MPLFSVIIPVYNSEKYLNGCVQSVLKQNFAGCEIILVDDCSMDKSWALSQALSRSIPNVTAVRHKENLGVGAAKNRGISAAAGEYVLFLDSDDRLAEGSLSGIAKLIREKPGTDIVVGKFICEPDINGEFRFEYLFERNGFKEEPREIVEYIKNLRGFTSVGWCYVINRKFLREQGLCFLPIRIFEDTEFVAKLLCLCKTFAFYDETFYVHKMRSGSLGRSMDYEYAAAGLAAMNGLTKFLSERSLSDVQKEFVSSRINNIKDVFTLCLFILGDDEVDRLALGLADRKKEIAERLIRQTKRLKEKDIYIFCAGIYGESVARILLSAGYNIKGFLDNNRSLHGSKIFGLDVGSPKILTGKSKLELAVTAVVICNQFKKNIDAISSQLQEFGLKKEQIVASNILDTI